MKREDERVMQESVDKAAELDRPFKNGWLSSKAANNPLAGMRVFPQVKGGFIPGGTKPGMNSVQIKRGENGVFWIVLNVFVALRYSAVSGLFKYRDLYQRAVA